MMIISLIVYWPKYDWWQEVAANKHLNLFRLPNKYFYLDFRPKIRKYKWFINQENITAQIINIA